MTKAILLLLLFLFNSFANAEDAPRAVAGETLEEAKVAIELAKKALEQASAWESLASKDLDKANEELQKKPKSKKNKQAVADAQKDLEAAKAYKAKKNTALQEEMLEKSAIEKIALSNQEKNKLATTKVETLAKAIIYPTENYDLFAEANESSERVDAYSFFNDPLDYNNKTVILDARLDEFISPGVAKFTIWRNFGKMHLIVSNVPTGDLVTKEKTMLLAGDITGFQKEVISGELVLNVLLKLKGAFVCSDVQCHSGRLGK